MDASASWWAPWCVAVLGAISLAVTLLRVQAPTIFPDEFGYLGVGRWLAGQGTHPDLAYEPGLGFLYAPFFWVTGSSAAAYELALLLNAVMLAAAYLLLARALAGRDEALRRGDLLAAGSIAFVQFTWFTHVAMAPTVLLLVTVIGFWAFRRLRSPAAFTAVMFLIGLSPVFHKRALVLLPAALVAVVVAPRYRTRLRSFLASAVPLSIGALIAFLAVNWNQNIEGRASIGVATHEVGVATNVLRRSGDVAVHLLSQASYEVLASGSLVVVGAVVAARWVRSDPDRRGAGLFVLVILGLNLLAVAARTAGGVQLREIFWGRYLTPFALPAIALGAQYLVRLRRREQGLALGVLFAGVVSALTIRYLPLLLGVRYQHHGDFDSPAIALFAGPTTSRLAQLTVAAMAVLLMSFFVATVLSRPRFARIAVVSMVVVSVLAVPSVYTHLFAVRSQAALQEGAPAARLAEVAEPGDCAYIDAESLVEGRAGSRRFIYSYRWYFPGVVHPLDSTTDCPWALTGDPDFGEEHPTWTKVFEDPRRPAHGLWKR